MTLNIQFPAQLTNLKYIKSTHVWRVELELFENTQVDPVTQLTGEIDGVFNVTLEYLDEDLRKDPLESIYNDEEIQFALGVSSPEEAAEKIKKRIDVDFNLLGKDEIEHIAKTIKNSIGD